MEPIAELLQAVIKAGPGNRALVVGYGTRLQAFTESCDALLRAVLKLDPQRARQQAEDVLLHGPQDLKPTALRVWSETRQVTPAAPVRGIRAD